MQNAEYLEALGVVQYRRRELQVRQAASQANDHDLKREVIHEPDFSREPGVHSYKPSAPLSEPNAPTPAPANKAPDAAIHFIHVDHQGDVAPKPEQPVGQKISFDLLVWKTDRLLVWEVSSGEADQVPAKHLLVNNVLKALWPANFQGAKMLQQSWPLPDANASKKAASDWLASMLAGHLQQAPKVPVWLMGETALELIPGLQDMDDSLSGTRIKHPQLDLELYIGPSPQAMFDSPISKARTWQLLRELRHG
jgi:hypothetical protein